MIKVKNSKEFDELFRALAADIVNAHIYYQLYRDVHQDLCDHPSVTRESNTFWQISLNSYVNICMQILCKVYDQHGKALHLHSWLLTIRENLHLFDIKEFRQRLKDNPFVESLVQSPRKPDPTILKEDIRLCSSNDPMVKTLIIHRNSHVAHTEAKNILAKRNPHDTHPLTFGDFEALLQRAKGILNRYGSLFAAVTYSTQMESLHDYRFILKSIEEKIQRMEEEAEKYD